MNKCKEGDYIRLTSTLATGYNKDKPFKPGDILIIRDVKRHCYPRASYPNDPDCNEYTLLAEHEYELLSEDEVKSILAQNTVKTLKVGDWISFISKTSRQTLRQAGKISLLEQTHMELEPWFINGNFDNSKQGAYDPRSISDILVFKDLNALKKSFGIVETEEKPVKKCVEPSFDEMLPALIQEAKKRFPIGSYVENKNIVPYCNIRFTVTGNTFYKGRDPNTIEINRNSTNDGAFTIYSNGKWAEVVGPKSIVDTIGSVLEQGVKIHNDFEEGLQATCLSPKEIESDNSRVDFEFFGESRVCKTFSVEEIQLRKKSKNLNLDTNIKPVHSIGLFLKQKTKVHKF